jgi:hypothetical protein
VDCGLEQFLKTKSERVVADITCRKPITVEHMLFCEHHIRVAEASKTRRGVKDWQEREPKP